MAVTRDRVIMIADGVKEGTGVLVSLPRARKLQRIRAAIVAAAGEEVAERGKDAFSVTLVGQRVGLSVGRIQQHFPSRTQLIKAGRDWISDRLYQAVYGDCATVQAEDCPGIEPVTVRLAEFAMEHQTLSRAWLLRVLKLRQPSEDRFWREFSSSFARFASTGYAQPLVDVEVVSVLILSGILMYPHWPAIRSDGAMTRRKTARRVATEVLRFCLRGTLRPDRVPELDRRNEAEVRINAAQAGRRSGRKRTRETQ